MRRYGPGVQRSLRPLREPHRGNLLLPNLLPLQGVRRGAPRLRRQAAPPGAATARLVGKRGAKRGSSHEPWEDWEWWVIEESLDKGITAREVHLNLLPHRSTANVHNARNLVRRRRRKLCMAGCGRPVDTPDTSCDTCMEKANTRRRDNIRRGLCSTCADPLGVGASMTLCPRCNDIRNKSHKKYLAKTKAQGTFKKPKTRPKRQAAFVYPRARSARRVLSLVPVHLKVVDLFGGMGSFSCLAHEQGLQVAAYNEIHPLAASLMHTIVQGQAPALTQTIKTVYKDLENPEDLDTRYEEATPGLMGAALFVLKAKGTQGRLTQPTNLLGPPRGLRGPANRLQTALRTAEVTQLDFLEAIDRFDSKDTLFLADPPWEGCDDAFEFKIRGRHPELADALLQVQGEFVLLSNSSRAAFKTWNRAPHLYWVACQNFVKELVATSLELKSPGLREVDPSRFGVAA